jgi:hypothetical protein
MMASRFKRAIVAICLLTSILQAGPQKRDHDRDRPPRNRHAEITLRLIEARSEPLKSAEDATQLVPAEVRKLFRYTHYGLLDSGYVRGREDQSLRIALAGNLQGRLKFQVDEPNAAAMRFDVEIEGAPGPKGERATLLETDISLKNGETIVLGASRMQGADRALIVLLTARLLP